MTGQRGYGRVVPRLVTIAEADPREEVCGLVVSDPGGALTVVPSPNVAVERRDGFEIDPAVHLSLARRLRREGGRIAAVYHSHVDGPAVLSRRDVEAALADGSPLMPGVDQIVIGMTNGKVLEVRAFAWSLDGFVGIETVVPGALGAKSRPS